MRDRSSKVWEHDESESTQKLDFCGLADQFGKGFAPVWEYRFGKKDGFARFPIPKDRTVRKKDKKMKMVNRAAAANPAVTLLVGILVLSSLLFTASPSRGQSSSELVVAAAADLSSALKDVADGFEKATGTKVKLSFGASGALTQQIQNGAPFDLFFSADMDYPKQLIAGGQADGASLYQYAVGKLVLWVPADSPLDVADKGMDVLLDPTVKKIAIANPQHAPYGRAAVAALKHAGLYDKVSDRLVMGENISQAAQFAESGNAQVGFVALAHVVAPQMQGKGKYWEVPADYYPALAQGVVVMAHSQHKKEAAEFEEYVKKDAAETLRKYGFTVP
jgi:molybdate transport system substrate-binding protein